MGQYFLLVLPAANCLFSVLRCLCITILLFFVLLFSNKDSIQIQLCLFDCVEISLILCVGVEPTQPAFVLGRSPPGKEAVYYLAETTRPSFKTAEAYQV